MILWLRKMAFVPNEDIRQELEIALDSKIVNKWNPTGKRYTVYQWDFMFIPSPIGSARYISSRLLFSRSGDFCIDLSGDNTAVSQQFLDIPDSGAIV